MYLPQIIHIEMTSICIFNPKKFYEMLSSTQNIDQSLTTFRNRCQSNDIHYMFPAVNILQDVIHSNNELPLTKYNALYTAQQMLLTLSYLSVLLVETYILPLLPPIALQFVARRSDQQLEMYFIERGFRSSVGIKIVSRKYVELAAQMVVTGAKIKPSHNILHSEIQQQSKFQQAYDSLLPDVQDSRNNFSINFQALRQGYLKRLKTFDPSNLIYFLWKTLKEEVVFNQGFSHTFKTLLQSRDFFISIPIVNSCIHQLSNLSKDFAHKRQFLSLFCSYIKKGNIYAIIAAHNSTFIRTIFQEVFTVRGDISISYGKMIFPEIDASHQEKEEFYCEFLRCIQIWGLCLQKNQVGEVSELKQMYDYLSKDREFQFPNILMLQKIIGDYAENLQLYQIENDQMLRLMDQNEHLLSQFQNFKTEDLTIIGEQRVAEKQASKTKPKASSTNPVASLKKALQTGHDQIGNQSFDDLFNQIQNDFKSLPREKSQLESRLNHLVQFQAQWPSLKEAYRSDLPSEIIKKGDELSLKIAAIKQLYLRLSKKQISWRVFQQKVALIIHPDKDSESYIQKIKQLPFPKKSVNEQNYSKRQEKQSWKMEVVELQFYSKINLKQKIGQAVSGVQQQKQGDRDRFVNNNLRSKRLENKVSQQKNSALEKSNINKALQYNESHNKQIIQNISKKPVSMKKRQQDQIKISRQDQLDRIEPVTHNDYGIQRLLIKRRQYLQQSNQSISKNSRTIKRQQIIEVQSKILPSDLLNSIQIAQKMVHSDDITSSKGQKSILKKHASLRSILDRSFRRSRISHKSPSQASLSQTFFKGESSCRAGEVEKIYQLRAQPAKVSNQNGSRYTEQKSAPVQPALKAYNFQRMIYSITSRSIQAYKQYVSRNNSKPKSMTNNASTQGTNSNNKSIIRKQFQRLRPKQKNQRTYQVDQSSNKAASRMLTPVLNSDVVTYNPHQTIDKNRTKVDQLLTNQSQAYFPMKYGRLIKNCLHSKGMLLETDLIEVGYVHYSKSQHLDFTLFITAKNNLKTVKLTVADDDHLKVAIETSQLRQLIKGKQETVKILTSLKSLPFKLPKLTFTVEDYSRKKEIHTVVMPCTINKYQLFEPVFQEDQSIVDRYKKTERYRSFFLKMSKKMEKKGSICKYLTFLGYWPGANQYVCEFIHEKESCLVGLTKDETGSWYLWGRTLNIPNTLSFLMSSFFFLLEE